MEHNIKVNRNGKQIKTTNIDKLRNIDIDIYYYTLQIFLINKRVELLKYEFKNKF